MQIKLKGKCFMKMKKNKLPDFKKMTREEEAKFWDTHSFADYWGEFKDINLVVELEKPKEETLIVRVNKNIKNKLTLAAKQKQVSVSKLARMWITERLHSGNL